MTIRSLIHVCGTSVALGLAGVAAAQQDAVNRSQPTTDNLTTTTASANDVDQLLEKRHGVWRVDLMVASDFWHRSGVSHRPGAVDQRYVTPGQPDHLDKPGQQDKEDPSNPWNRQPDARPAPDRLDQPGQVDKENPSSPWWDDEDQRNRAGQPADAHLQPDAAGMTHLSGYAECDLVLDESILREHIVVPMAGEQLDPNAQPDPNQRLSDGSYRGITFIEFNKDSKSYDMVIVDNMSEGIKFDSGYFDAQLNRIVFRGQGNMHTADSWRTQPADPNWSDPTRVDPTRTDPVRDPTDPTRDKSDPVYPDRDETDPNNPDRFDPNRDTIRPTETAPPGAVDRTVQPDTQWRQNAGAKGKGLENVVVVLEIVDDNTHRVTMYDTSAGTQPMTDPNWRDRPSGLDDDVDDADDLNDDLDDAADDLKDDLDDAADDLDDDLDDDIDDDLDDADDLNDADDRQDDDVLDQNRREADDAITSPRQPTTTQPTTAQPIRTSGEFGKVIYQATYTRAPASMEASIRSMIERETVLVSR
jgi:hypothetical protein